MMTRLIPKIFYSRMGRAIQCSAGFVVPACRLSEGRERSRYPANHRITSQAGFATPIRIFTGRRAGPAGALSSDASGRVPSRRAPSMRRASPMMAQRFEPAR